MKTSKAASLSQYIEITTHVRALFNYIHTIRTHVTIHFKVMDHYDAFVSYKNIAPFLHKKMFKYRHTNQYVKTNAGHNPPPPMFLDTGGHTYPPSHIQSVPQSDSR